MKIGFVQFAPALADLDTTLERLDALLQQTLAAEAVDLLVLPELCNSGYNFSSLAMAFNSAETVEQSRFIRYLSEQCATHNLHIVSGFNERADESLYNSAVLVGPQGFIGQYRKLHLFLNEQDFFEPGNLGLPTFDIGGCKIGLLVCFDWVFPEVWRALALKGVDIICHPSNLVLPGLCQSAVPTHGLINRLFVVTANRIGTERDLTFTGLSLIANPHGQVLQQATATEATVGLVTVDLASARNKMITARNHLFTDRRLDVYGDLGA